MARHRAWAFLAVFAAAVAAASWAPVMTADDISFEVSPSDTESPEDAPSAGANDSPLLAPPNNPPVAADDAYPVDHDSTLTVGAPGVLTNDSDADGETLAALPDSGPWNGSLTLNADGSFTYTPAPGFHGIDIFTYVASDGIDQSDPATVIITVNPPPNTPPVALPDSYSTEHDTPLTVGGPGVLANDSDKDGDKLAAVPDSGPWNGSLILNADGSFIYTPDPGFHGTDAFTYKANDGTEDSLPALVTIAVNSAPTAADDAYSVAYGKTLAVPAPGVLANDSDADNDPLTATKVPGSGPWNGTVTLQPNGAFIYQPNAGFHGTDVFKYKASDGIEDSAPATVAITVKEPNKLPVAAPDSYSVELGKTLTVPPPGVLANDTDPEGSPLTAVKDSGPWNGSLTLQANGGFTYTPEPGFTGTDLFRYKANDGTDDSTPATVTITVTLPNSPPVAADDSYSVDESKTLTIAAPGVLTNDTDAEKDPLTAAKVAGPAHGTLTLNADGSFTYTPTPGYHGPDSFTYKANDGKADSAPATVAITVNATNLPPVAADDAYSVNQDQTLAVIAPGVLGNDTDPDLDTLKAVLVSGPWNGLLTLDPDGSFTYTPAPGFHGTDLFFYLANDGTEDSASAMVTLTVNAPPAAVDDAYSVDQDQTLTVAAAGVLANDTDAEADPLTAAEVTGPAHGALTLHADGSFSYTPTPGYRGPDSFTYKANDGQADSAPATVSITVNAVNAPPVAAADAYAVNQGQTLTVGAPGVLANDTDPDGDPLAAVPVSGPWNGTLTLHADGSFTYTPDAGFRGTDIFLYAANDGTADSAPAVVTITVNAPPVAADDAYSVDQDQTLTVAAPGVLANDTDPDGDPLTAAEAAGPAHGALTLNADGSFTYTPTPGYSGPDSFTYKANDSQADSAPATVALTVKAGNRPPAAAADAYWVVTGKTLSVPAPGVLGNDSDPDGDPLTAVLVTGPAKGSLSLNADGSFTYTSAPGFTGAASFTYKANDGAADSAPATVTITVGASDIPPVAADDAYGVEQDTTLTVGAPGVLANDTDAELDPLTAIVEDEPWDGTLTLNADGSFVYVPNPGFHGVDVFTYRANDGMADSAPATVLITVNAPANPNRPPVAVADAYSVVRDTTLAVGAPGVLANDTDPDGDPLTAVWDDGPWNGSLFLNDDGSFTYTPDAGFTGTDAFTYKAFDGTDESAPVLVTIVVNTAPVALPDAYTVDYGKTLTVAAPGILGNDTDADGDPLTAIKVSGPWNGTLALQATGAFTYKPAAGFHGIDHFTYKANDGFNDSDPVSVVITVNPPNTPPVAVTDSYTAQQTKTLSVVAPGVLANDTDADGDPLTAALSSPTLNGTLKLNANGSFTYTPDKDFLGTDTFRYKASDGKDTSAAVTVSIDVTPPNNLPVAADDSYSVDESKTLTVDAPGVLGNDTDADGDPLKAIEVKGPAHGTLTLNDDGSFTYTPTAGYNGPDSFTYKANDGLDDSAPATVTITVNRVNHEPVAADDQYTADQDTALTVPAPGVLENDTDPDGDQLQARLINGPWNGTLDLQDDGSFTYTPDPGFHGTDLFFYVANDGTYDSNQATVTLTVLRYNTPPVAVDDAYRVTMDNPLIVDAPGVLANDTDAEGDPLTAAEDTGPANGTLLFNADGSFTYTPDPGFVGTDSFTYIANDGRADSLLPATVTITVNGPPVAVDDSYAVAQDTTLTVDPPGVLENDSDPNGDALTAVLQNGPYNGVLALNDDGSFTYTPDPGFVGTDSFTYRASDGELESASATVLIAVVRNAPPDAMADTYQVNQDEILTIDPPGVLENDTDPEGDPLTAVPISGPWNGALILNDDGGFTYIPDQGFSGTDGFVYVANDGLTDSAPTTVMITVIRNIPPDAQDDFYLTFQDTPLTVDPPGVLENDTDPEGDPLTAILVDLPLNGTVNLNPDGSFDYTPDPGFSGIDGFTYVANDGHGDSALAAAIILVIANESPVAADDAYQVDQDTTLTVDAPGVLENDFDPEGDPITAVWTSGPWNGSLLLNSDGSFTYTPDPGFVGTDTFAYAADDGNSTSAPAPVTITVNAIPPPQAAPDSYTVVQGTTLTVAAPGVLANDSDPQGDPLIAVLVDGPWNGSLSLDDDGSFDYTPDPDFVGNDSFTYLASDGTYDSAPTTATIEVTPAAIGQDLAYTSPQAWGHNHTPDHHHRHGARMLKVRAPGVLAGAIGPHDAALTAVLIGGPANGKLALKPNGSFRYRPNRDYLGTDTFTYKTNMDLDGAPPATVTISARPIARTDIGRHVRHEVVNGQRTGKWQAVAKVRVVCTQGHGTIQGTVQGHWTGAATGAASGTTNNGGRVKFVSAMITGHGTARFVIDSVVPIANAAVLHGRTARQITGP